MLEEFNMRCLLIETKDKRKFFTNKKNLIQLNEFSKTFDSNIFIVDLQDGKLMELEDLATAICSPEYIEHDYDYKIIDQIKNEIISNKTKKSKKINVGPKIQEFITKEFLEKRPISIKKIKSRFKNHSISDATFYNKIRKVKSELEKKGFKFIKVKTGVYKTK